MSTEINWGAATEIVEIRTYLVALHGLLELTEENLSEWAGYPVVLPIPLSPLTEGVQYVVDGDTLVLLKTFFEMVIAVLGHDGVWVDLAIEFDACPEKPVNLTVRGVAADPSFLLPSEEYDICDPLLASEFTGMVPSWGIATDVYGFQEATLNGESLASIYPSGYYGIGPSLWDLLVDGETHLPILCALGGESCDGASAWSVMRSYYLDLLGTHVDLVVWWGWFLNMCLQHVGDELWMVVEFDSGHTAEYSIIATGRAASISPTKADYNIDWVLDGDSCVPCADTWAHNVSTIVTWGCDDKAIEKIVDLSYNATADPYDDVPEELWFYPDYPYIGDYWIDPVTRGCNETTGKLYIYDTYLRRVLTYPGDSVELTIVFTSLEEVDCHHEPHTETLTITATAAICEIEPSTGEYDLTVDDPDVTFFVTKKGCCTDITGVYKDFEALTNPDDYTVTTLFNPVLNEWVTELVIKDAWISSAAGGDIQDVGDEVDLTVVFDYGTTTITIEGVEDEADPVTCFIATAVYGEDGDATNILREFRDKYLLTNPVGKALVDLYYRVSPPIAQFLTEHPALQPMVRAMLLPAVALGTIAVNTSPAAQIAILVLLLASVAVAVWATRRRERGPAYV
jgi:hypothetical protein